jgi:hypothetical protein
MRDDLKSFFLNPQNPKHRQFEALRSYIVDELPAKEAAESLALPKNLCIH